MDLEQRVERLEQENRRLRRAGLAVLALVVSVAILDATVPQEPEDVTARSFRVIDESGNVRAAIQADGIFYDDENSTTRVQLGRAPDAETRYPAQVILFDADGRSIWRAVR